MILIIDNYDSFTHNLVQYVGEFNYKVQIIRNDKIDLKKIARLNPKHIIISPGPGCPQETGQALNIIKHFASTVPILGVCLGHQSIGYLYGGNIIKLQEPVHGKISKIYHNRQDIFSNLPNPFEATRYHSLIIDNKSLPSTLQITATTNDGTIMACRHRQYRLMRGIQFHPESLWTKYGKAIIKNFLST